MIRKRCQEKLNDGSICGIGVLSNENKCLCHSSSEIALKLKSKGGRKGKNWLSNEDLLRLLTKELKRLDNLKIKEPEKIKMKQKYLGMIIEVQQKVEQIKDLEKRLKKLEI